MDARQQRTLPDWATPLFVSQISHAWKSPLPEHEDSPSESESFSGRAANWDATSLAVPARLLPRFEAGGYRVRCLTRRPENLAERISESSGACREISRVLRNQKPVCPYMLNRRDERPVPRPQREMLPLLCNRRRRERVPTRSGSFIWTNHRTNCEPARW